MKNYEELTEKQKEVIKYFLMENTSMSKKASSLLKDNMTCQTMPWLVKGLGISANILRGVIGSLLNEGILLFDEDDGDGNMYWVNDDFLEILDPDKEFKNY